MPADLHASNRTGAALLRLARRAIDHGLLTGTPMVVAGEKWSAELREPGAAFVTLTRERTLRGCVGNLRPRQALGAQVAQSAFQAAFGDPRMTPVTADEVDQLAVEVSVLSLLQAVDAETDAALIGILAPGVHGVLAEAGDVRATFLPRVWEDLPDPRRFLAALRQKAGLGSAPWPADTRFYRYTTEVWLAPPSSLP